MLLFNKYLNKGKCQLNNNDVNTYVFVTDAAKFIFENLKQNGLLVMSGTPVKNSDIDEMISSTLKNDNKE